MAAMQVQEAVMQPLANIPGSSVGTNILCELWIRQRKGLPMSQRGPTFDHCIYSAMPAWSSLLSLLSRWAGVSPKVWKGSDGAVHAGY